MAKQDNVEIRKAAIARWREVRQGSVRLRQAIAAEPAREPLLREAFLLGFMGGGAYVGQVAAALGESLGEQRNAELTRVFGEPPVKQHKPAVEQPQMLDPDTAAHQNL